MDDYMFIEMEEDDDNEEEEYDDDDDYEDEEYYEDEEVDELIPVEMPSVSSLIADGTMWQEPVAMNVDSNEFEGKQRTGVDDGENKESITGEIDVCPICFQLWSSGGDHRICCLPCGHIYGMSCINKWLQQCQGSGKCPQCNSLCTSKDVKVLYATRLCVIDEEFRKRERSLEAKCAYLEEKVQSEEKIMERMREEMQLQLKRLHEEKVIERMCKKMQLQLKKLREEEVYARLCALTLE